MNEPERPYFDIVRASFYLVAFVFVAYTALIFITIVLCAWNIEELLKVRTTCIKEGGLLEALSTLLASALAFAAGRSIPPRGDK